MPRKILFYTHAFSGGGAETVFARLAGAFADGGDSVIFCADHRGDEPVVQRPNLEHTILGADHGKATRRLASILRREQPHASFSALGAQNLKHLAAAVAAGRANRCVLGYHGFAVAEPKRLSRSSFVGSAVITRLAARTICVSDTLLADIRTRWHASRRKTLRIYNPISGGTPAVALPARPPLVVACGRLVPVKRFPDLVAAFATVEPRDARLTLLGEGPDRPAIEAAVSRFDLGDRVTMPGHVQDPSAWYCRAACVVITSASESFGLTAAEALSHGVPVVSTDCGGPPEILCGGRYGRIVPVGDVQALAAALTQTLAEPGDPGPRVARARDFSLASIHAAYAALADTLV